MVFLESFFQILTSITNENPKNPTSKVDKVVVNFEFSPFLLHRNFDIIVLCSKELSEAENFFWCSQRLLIINCFCGNGGQCSVM